MARPKKDNADYFSHDADMRDDPKIKALRRKFKVEGYGIWCMLLESITDSDNFRLYLDLDIISGDFDCDPNVLSSVVQYCVQLGLLSTNDDCKIIWSKTLDNRFSSLLSKRKRDRTELSLAKTPKTDVIASDSAQSTVKESTVKETITARDLWIEFSADKKFINDLERAHPGKNIKLGLEQCFNHHSAFKTPPEHSWQWKQKLNTWLGIMKKSDNGKPRSKNQ